LACGGGTPIDGDTDGDSGVDTDTLQIIPLESLAILLAVDNSISMGEEQSILADGVGKLAVSLTGAFGVDDIRVAAVTSDMGLSWGGFPYEDGDGWPGTNPCSASGDDGAFQTCGDAGAAYAETSPESPDPDLGEHMGCLANQGTSGCGFEQQLQSIATAFERDDQQDFVRGGDLLLILVITDEDDCSIEDGPALFNSDEIQGTEDEPSNLNLACQENEETLYSTGHYAGAFWAAQQNAYNAVIFAAIVGVPQGPSCEGFGDEIGDCLDHPHMQPTEPDEEDEIYYVTHACTREEDSVLVTMSIPGRRFVDLSVNYFGKMSYVYSICNADWTPAMNHLALMIAQEL
jgi:hypothetical protein